MTNPMTHPSKLLLPFDGPRTLPDQTQLASLLAQANIGIPPDFRGDAGGILAIIYRAMSLNIPVMVAMDNLVFNTRGVCAMRARLMKALVTIRAGHTLVPVENTDKRAVVRLEYSSQDGRKPFTAEWTIATAQAAGLIKEKSPWGPYAASMLYWRAMAKAVQLGCPEATLGIGIMEAMDPEDDEDDTTTQPSPMPEDITAVDTEGRPVASGVVVDILASLATTGPEGRPIVEDATTIKDLQDAWKRANRQTPDSSTRPLKQFAYASGSDRYTLEQVIGDLVDQVTTRDKAQAEAAAQQTAAEEEANRPATEQALSAPAGTGTMGCGCEAATLAATGAHAPGCTQ